MPEATSVPASSAAVGAKGAATDEAFGALPPDQSPRALVLECARGLRMLDDGARVLVACSGGPDSTALAFLVAAARPDLRQVMVYVAHALRDPADDEAEARLVAAHAARIGCEFIRRDVAVVPGGHGIEAAARDARYAALEEEVRRSDAAAILLGHHAEDQAETMLLRLARGTGPDGLSGMEPSSGERVRPLLRVRREDLRAFCAAQGLEVAQDPTNMDTDIRRVRVREDLLPGLERIGPDPVGALARLATLLRDESRALADIAEMSARALPVRHIGMVSILPSDALRALPVALARRIVRIESARIVGRSLEATAVERVLRAPDGERMTLPGPLEIGVSDGWHVLAPSRPLALAPRTLGGDGGVLWAGTGWRLTLTTVTAAPAASDRAHEPLLALERMVPGLVPERMAVRLGATGPFVVRARRAGDRIRTPGGTRLLADIMSEAGVPRALRDQLPIVAIGDEAQEVLWVPGLVVDAARQGGPGAVGDAGGVRLAVH